MLKSWLSHPLLRNVPLDDPLTTRLRREIIQQKPFLNKVYQEWYRLLVALLPAGDHPILELGSGGGFLREYIPDLITSDVIYLPWLSVVLDGHHLPFSSGAFGAVVMCNTFHHFAVVEKFLMEASRCVRRGGLMVMLEPWVTKWSSFVYSKFHHESFDPHSKGWDLPRLGPLTTADGALPWKLFVRDRQRFEEMFPYWRIKSIQEIMPLRYLLSGGVSLRSLMPSWSFGFWRALEGILNPWRGSLAMFALIVLEQEK